jgi:large subunit ribosomal protein L1
MGKIGPLGRVLGPRGLMPNPKSGTVTMDVAKAVKEVKQGKIDFKVDKSGIIHTSIGKVSMTPEQLYGNAKEFISTVIKLKPAAAKEAGADHVGLDEYIEKIKQGWTDVDVIITMPSCMGKLGPLGRVLGPRGLMPNPKSGTVTMDVAKAVKEVKQGKIDFKVDKAGIVHASIGKVSFTPEQIFENAKEFLQTIIKLKPAAAKGTYMKSVFISSTMSAGIKVDPKSVE